MAQPLFSSGDTTATTTTCSSSVLLLSAPQTATSAVADSKPKPTALVPRKRCSRLAAAAAKQSATDSVEQAGKNQKIYYEQKC